MITMGNKENGSIFNAYVTASSIYYIPYQLSSAQLTSTCPSASQKMNRIEDDVNKQIKFRLVVNVLYLQPISWSSLY